MYYLAASFYTFHLETFSVASYASLATMSQLSIVDNLNLRLIKPKLHIIFNFGRHLLLNHQIYGLNLFYLSYKFL